MEELKLLLVGRPNAGKSTIFNALTGGHAKVGNWHGVTVGAAERGAVLGEKTLTVVDLPGMYSFDGMSMEEKLTREYLVSSPNSYILFVAECGALPRAVELIRALKNEGRIVFLALTKRRDFERRGGRINVDLLSERLGIPAFFADGRSRKGRAMLKTRLQKYLDRPVRGAGETGDFREAFTPPRAGLSRADQLLCNPIFCISLFLLLIVFAFYITFAPNLLGDRLKSLIEELFMGTLYRGAEGISSPIFRSFVQDGLLSSLGGVLCFLPQIALLFLFLILMEESGFLSRLAVHTDGAFSAVGLNGRAVFSLLMGFGCTAAAILTTRGLDDKKIQRRVILSLPYISCSAKLPVFLTLAASFFENPFFAVMLLYAFGIVISFTVALLLKGKDTPTFVLELAPLQIPNPIFVLKNLFFQIKQFIIKVATIILAFFLLSWILTNFDFTFTFVTAEESMLATLCGGLKYLFAPIGCCDWKIAYAAVSGLIAKENIAGILNVFFGGFPYSAESAFAFAVFVLTCSPCVSAISATAREVGWKRALLYACSQTGSALLLSYATYFALNGGAVYLLCIAAPLLAFLLIGKRHYETVHGKRRSKSEKLHR